MATLQCVSRRRLAGGCAPSDPAFPARHGKGAVWRDPRPWDRLSRTNSTPGGVGVPLVSGLPPRNSTSSRWVIGPRKRVEARSRTSGSPKPRKRGDRYANRVKPANGGDCSRPASHDRGPRHGVPGALACAPPGRFTLRRLDRRSMLSKPRHPPQNPRRSRPSGRLVLPPD